MSQTPQVAPSPPVSVVIVVEDPLLRSLLSERLMQEPDMAVVGAVGDPAGLREAIRATEPQVAVLDLHWTGAAGLALLDQLTAHAPEVMPLALVSDESEETQLEAAQHGARGVVPKSEGAAILPFAIRAVGRGEIWFTRQISCRIFQEYHRLVHQLRTQEHPLAVLSERERDVLVCVAEGKTNREIAEVLLISVHTVKLHIQRILSKLQLPNRTEAAVFAVREGLVSNLPQRSDPGTR
jgi:DNA-binding NarL/FixJ family response regulator